MREFVFAGGLQDRSDDVELMEGNAAPPPKFFFSYSAPIITDLNPANGPTTGAFVVTITGRHFGHHWNERMPFDGRVRFNMSLCAPQQVGITPFAYRVSLNSSYQYHSFCIALLQHVALRAAAVGSSVKFRYTRSDTDFTQLRCSGCRIRRSAAQCQGVRDAMFRSW